MSPPLKKAIGSFGLLAYLCAYIVGAIELANHIPQGAMLVQLAFFAVAGIAWVLPLRPVIRWMNSPAAEETS